MFQSILSKTGGGAERMGNETIDKKASDQIDQTCLDRLTTKKEGD